MVEALGLWHDECRAEHPECSKTFSNLDSFDVEDVPLPTRCVEVLIDHSQHGIGGAYRYVLRDTKGQRGKYIALSHRWGAETERCKTTRRTLRCRMDDCPARGRPCDVCRGRDLPISRLFEDAAKLSLQVGVKYIWIDSLCIV